MSRTLALAALAAFATATSAHAQDPHAGHRMTALPAGPAPASAEAHAGHQTPATTPSGATTDPRAGHAAPAALPPPDPHAAHEATSPAPVGPEPSPPPLSTDFDADRYFGKAEMDAARARLAKEHGHIAWSKVTFEKLEVRPGSPDGYAWEGRASFGGDINRLVLKSRGEGDRKLERGEVEVLWGRAIAPWFNLQAGARQDLQHDGRTYAVIGTDGLAPFEFDLDAAMFLSTHGDLSARVEAAHDYRLSRRLILEPRAEVNFAASTVPSQEVGSGLARVELGLRLRYAIIPELAPYVGVEHERAIGRTARLVRSTGEDARVTRFVAGLRAWF